MARRAQSENTIYQVRRNSLDRRRESIYSRHGGRGAGNAGGGQRRKMRQNSATTAEGLTAPRCFFCLCKMTGKGLTKTVEPLYNMHNGSGLQFVQFDEGRAAT